MTPQTFIFFGPSGSGKGTQAKLLMERLKVKDPETQVLYIETGQKFREFAEESSFAAKQTKAVLGSGGLLPAFLPIWLWTEYLIRHLDGDEHMILDGLSRRAHEAPILDSAMQFFQREKPFVISIEIPREVSAQRLRDRKRADDNNLDIENRLNWYDQNVVPAINYFRENDYYKFISIDGNRSIEEVSADILEKVGLN